MSSYRQIYTSFWTDNYIMDLASQAKLLFLYLLTSNRSSQCGMFEFNLKDASLVTGIKARKLSEMLNKFHKDGKILYEEKTSEIMMVNWFKYNVVCKSCKIRKHVNKELQCIKSSTLLNLFYDKCLEECNGNVQAMSELFGGIKSLQHKLSLLISQQEPSAPDDEVFKAAASANDASSECSSESEPQVQPASMSASESWTDLEPMVESESKMNAVLNADMPFEVSESVDCVEMTSKRTLSPMHL